MRVFMREKCEARSRVCVCLETLCMDLMHGMDCIHSVYGVSSVIQGGLKALSPPNHGSLTLMRVLYSHSLVCMPVPYVAGRPDIAAWHADSVFEH